MKDALSYPARTPADAWVAKKLGIPLPELTQEKLEAWQVNAFRETLRHAKAHSRFYGELMKDIDPDALLTMGDIRALPFTTEADLAGNEWRFQCVSPGDVSRTVTVPTTGTSGRNKRIMFTRNDQLTTMEFIRVGFETMCAPGDRMLVMMSGGTPGSIGDAVGRALSGLNITTEVHGAVTDIADAYRHIMEFRPNVITGIPYQAAALARYGQQFGNPEREFIRSVLLSADDVPDSVCDRLRTLWNCNTFRNYGMTEMYFSGGVECLGYDGYHLRSCGLLFEIVDADENGYGEIVITTLLREAMPLIRYRTGDIGRFSEGECPCGSPLRRIREIRGRKRYRLDVGGAQIFLSDISNAAFSAPETVDFSCAYAPGGLLKLTVGVLPGSHADPAVIRRALCQRMDIAAVMESGVLRLEIEEYSTTGFEAAYNSKKRIEWL